MSRNIDPGGGSYLTATNTGVNFTGEMTVAVWARLDAAGGYLFSRSNGSPQRFGFGVWSAAGSYGAFLGNGSFNATHITGVVDPRLAIWDHVVFRVTGGTGMSLYVNGKLDATATSAQSLTSTVDALTFGGWVNHGAGEAMDGVLGEVAVWNYALNYEQIVELYQGRSPERILHGNLRGYWTLRDGGPLERDRSAFACHATPTLSQSVTEQPPRGSPFMVMFGAEQTVVPDVLPGFLNVGTGLFAPASVTESGIFAPSLNVGVGLFVPTFLDLVYAPFLDLGTRVTNPTMIDGEPPPFTPPSLPGTSPGGGPGGTLPPLSSGGLAGIRFYQGPPWRWVVTDLASQTLTFLDRLAAEAVVTYTLDHTWTAKLSVPADNPEVNILHTDGDPFVSEGNRLLYGFRREGSEPKWVCRFAGKILHVEDTGEAEDARTILTAHDPRQILYQRPMVNYDFEFPDKAGFFSFDNTQTGVIALTFLRNTIFNNGDVGIDVGNLDFATVDNMPGTGYWGGAYTVPWSYRTKSEYETTTQIDVDCQQGMMVAEVWDQMIETGTLNLVLTPVYDPIRRPGILCELGIYQRLGDVRYEAVMSWDKPGRNLRAFNSIRDGTKRANVIRYYADQGGPPVGPYLGYANGTSITKYGETWHEEFWPSRIGAVVDALAQLQLTLMENGIHTVEVTPAPERMPFLFTEWFLGDTVPVYTSDKARQENIGFQRIYGIVLNIDENSYEQVPQVLTSPEA